MGIKRFFKIKPPEEATPEVNRDDLMELGIPTKNPNRTKKEKFAAYGRFAKDKADDKVYAPPGYENQNKGETATLDDFNKSEFDPESTSNVYMKEPNKSDFDPYARNNYQNAGASSNPYEKQQMDPYASSNVSRNGARGQGYSAYEGGSVKTDPYAQGYGQAPSPYGRNNTYGQPRGDAYNGKPSASSQPYPPAQPSQNPYSVMKDDPYGSGRSTNSVTRTQSPNPYAYGAGRHTPVGGAQNDHFDFEAAPQRSTRQAAELNEDDIDLNATIQDEGDDLNGSIHEGYGGYGQGQQQQQQEQQQEQRGYQTFEDIQRENEERQQQQEDEEVDEIKQQIRFTKQSSVASTRNTLKMAQEAEMAGTNTLGMLGHQSEKLNNVERNLDLMKMQNRVADDKVAELKKLNRNILAVHVSNPFTSKRRLREAEERIRNQRIEDKLMQKETTGRLHKSTNRIEGALNGSANEIDSVKERYQNQAILEKAKRYQFENDEEDDELELELDKNLDKVGQISGRLKRLAIAAGDEIDAQQGRVKNIEEDTDNMDIKIHLNTTRLTQIR